MLQDIEMKNKFQIFVMIFFLINLGYSQKNTEKSVNNDSIAFYSNLLNGKWEFIGYYKNNQFIETELSYTINERNGKTYESSIISTDTGFVKKNFIDKTLISTETVPAEEIEFQLKNDGTGTYKDYFVNIFSDSNELAIDSEQSTPKIKLLDKEYVIEWTDLIGKRIEKLKVSKDSLSFLDSEKIKKKYKRKNNAL